MTFTKMRFLTKLLSMFIGVVLLLQIVTYVIARTALLDSTVSSATNTLKLGVDVFRHSIETESAQLAASVSVLVNDFGFRAAVATHDSATIESALQNQAARVGADVALVLDRDGHLLADTGTGAVAEGTFSSLMADADKSNSSAANLVLNGTPYTFVVSTVRAPARIGWVAMGFKLDDDEAQELKRLTLLDVAFFVGNESTQHSESVQHYVSGTLKPVVAEELRHALSSRIPNMPTQLALGDTQVLAIAVPLSEGTESLTAVLQMPMQQALEPYYMLSKQLLWIALGGLVLAGAIAFLVAHRLTDSVRTLVSASSRIATGDYSNPVSVESDDEMSDLADTLNTMQHAIVEREQKILFHAEHDQLTGLPNRSVAERKLTAALGHQRRTTDTTGGGRETRHPVSVIVIDINNFKAINDAFGHGIGDQVLQHAAERTQTSVKNTDTVVRLGNDEFLMVLDGVDRALAQQVAQRVLSELGKPLYLDNLKFVIDAHAGIATYPDDGDSAEVLMRRADIAMTHGKQEGNNALGIRICGYQQGWEETRLRRLALVNDLLDAISHGGLTLKFQPKLSLSNSDYLGAEALVRWQHPTLGFIGPDEFIPLAETSGHIVALTRWVIDTAIAQISRWTRADLLVKVSVNISTLDLLDESLPAYIETTLKLHGVDASALCIEVTEGSAMYQVERSLANLHRLRELGIRISVDDFGTGYSSLAQLKKLPIDELKIDKSFVLKLDQNSDDRVIVHSTIELGHNMGLQVVAEGLETLESLTILRELGCDMVQGYLLARPLAADEFSEWVRIAKQRAENV